MDDDENKVVGKQEEKAPEGGQAAKTKANSTKMGPGGCPKGAKMEPKSRKMLTRRAGAPKRRPNWRNMGFGTQILGPHLGPKIDVKSIFGEKVGPGGSVSIEFCCACCVFGFLGRILVDFQRKIDENCSDLCCISSPFSQPGHPHDTSYFTM